MLTSNTIQRGKYLAGIIIKENVELQSSVGRSDAGTLSYFIEEYLLGLGTLTLNKIDSLVTKNNAVQLSISYSNTKISQNSLTIKIIADSSTEFILNFMVKFESDSSTTVAISNDGIVDNFNLNSKHKKEDLELLANSIANYILNRLKKPKLK
jgi:hypothetical protein